MPGTISDPVKLDPWKKIVAVHWREGDGGPFNSPWAKVLFWFPNWQGTAADNPTCSGNDIMLTYGLFNRPTSVLTGYGTGPGDFTQEAPSSAAVSVSSLSGGDVLDGTITGYPDGQTHTALGDLALIQWFRWLKEGTPHPTVSNFVSNNTAKLQIGGSPWNGMEACPGAPGDPSPSTGPQQWGYDPVDNILGATWGGDIEYDFSGMALTIGSYVYACDGLGFVGVNSDVISVLFKR